MVIHPPYMHTKQMKFGDLVGFKKSDIEKA